MTLYLFALIPPAIVAGIIVAWLLDWVGEAIVEPINPKNGLITVKLRARKRRWQKLWDDWKAPVLVIAGVIGALAAFWAGMGVGCN